MTCLCLVNLTGFMIAHILKHKPFVADDIHSLNMLVYFKIQIGCKKAEILI